MADPYRNVTTKKILAKIYRRRNPVNSLVQLAHEFGISTDFERSNGTVGHSAPTRFRKLVQEAGTAAYMSVRDGTKVR